MAMRAWLAKATTGEVVMEAPLNDGSTLGSAIGGGTLNASIPAGLYRRGDGSLDADRIETLLSTVTGGRHTMVLTSGSRVLGEWLIWIHKRSVADGSIPVTGFEWEQYPKHRSVHRPFKQKNTDIGVVHQAALSDAYNTFQPGDAQMVACPTLTYGETVNMNFPSRSGYYSDILDDLDEFGLAEWRVVSSASWSNGVPTKISRRVQYGKPTLFELASDTLLSPPEGRRGGNITDLVRSNNYSRIVQNLIGWGAGRGGKQRFAMAQEFGWTARGYVATTRNESFPGEMVTAELEAKAAAALRAAQDPWETTSVTVNTDRMSSLPKVGGVHTVTVGACPAFPRGESWRMRIGEVTWRIGSPLVDLEMEEA